VFYHYQVTKKQDVTNVTNVYQKKLLNQMFTNPCGISTTGGKKEASGSTTILMMIGAVLTDKNELQNNQESVSQPEGLDPTSIAFLVLK
jgi:hypothetical protein